jgi:hypothetical protein
MFDRIMFARIGWGDVYEGEELVGNFSEPKVSGSWWERFNFKRFKGRCYGYIPPMGKQQFSPRPKNWEDWLVIFAATENGRRDGVLLPVGWYEESTIESDYQDRPEKGLKQPYEYILTTEAANAYLIPKEKRPSFPTIPTEHFKHCFVYARSPSHGERWRKVYADLAEKIVSRKRICKRIG